MSNGRELMVNSAQRTLGMAIGDHLLASQVSSSPSPLKDRLAGNGFPAKFLWGAATAAHQVEGNNINSDAWLLQHLPHSRYKEPSGDAGDHCPLYEQDINLLADLGLQCVSLLHRMGAD